jgi:hypothetical protein
LKKNGKSINFKEFKAIAFKSFGENDEGDGDYIKNNNNKYQNDDIEELENNNNFRESIEVEDLRDERSV